jgi:NAD(P)-dependent dehydrogenase (short-subunit alcohol dehydrogenase family)
MVDFTSQTVIVTGAGGNVGAAIARELAKRGARLALVDMSKDALSAIASEIAGDCQTYAGVDVRNEAETLKTAHAIRERFGRIDALANTVGTFRMGRIDADATAHWQMLMELNAMSALVLIKAVAPLMAANGYGRMLHVAAGAGLRGGVEMSVYSASKAALLRVVESAGEEFRASGVTANCILPTTIDTPQNRAAMPGADTSTWIKPAAIAEAAALLLSRQAGAITGAAIPLSGG